jgi:hypothetical protein
MQLPTVNVAYPRIVQIDGNASRKTQSFKQAYDPEWYYAAEQREEEQKDHII